MFNLPSLSRALPTNNSLRWRKGSAGIGANDRQLSLVDTEKGTSRFTILRNSIHRYGSSFLGKIMSADKKGQIYIYIYKE